MVPQIHLFGSSGEAYDASQCDENISDGDVLSVPKERVVGILVQAWPVAVSFAAGEFHTLSDGVQWDAVPNFLEGPPSDYSASFLLAMEEIHRLPALSEQMTATGHAVGAIYRSSYWGGTYKVVAPYGEYGVLVECVEPGGGAHQVPGEQWSHSTKLDRRDERLS